MCSAAKLAGPVAVLRYLCALGVSPVRRHSQRVGRVFNATLSTESAGKWNDATKTGMERGIEREREIVVLGPG